MQSHFTDKAKAALICAEKSAKSLKQGYVGTEHILLGLLKEGTGVAAKVLVDNGVTCEAVAKMIKELIAFDAGIAVQEKEGYSPRAKKVLAEALSSTSLAASASSLTVLLISTNLSA